MIRWHAEEKGDMYDRRCDRAERAPEPRDCCKDKEGRDKEGRKLIKRDDKEGRIKRDANYKEGRIKRDG